MADKELPAREPDLGDLRLYERFVHEHQEDVFTYVSRMIGNKEDAADLTQEALLHTYRTWAQVDPASGLVGYLKWCYRIARNLCIDFRRKKRPKEAEEEEFEKAVDEKNLRPEEVYESQIRANAVREELLALPVKYREVLLLRYQVEMSYEMIAEVLEVPVTTIETRIHRAKKLLRERLMKHIEV